MIKLVESSKACNKECKLYSKKYANYCSALKGVVACKKCSFFKPKMNGGDNDVSEHK